MHILASLILLASLVAFTLGAPKPDYGGNARVLFIKSSHTYRASSLLEFVDPDGTQQDAPNGSKRARSRFISTVGTRW